MPPCDIDLLVIDIPGKLLRVAENLLITSACEFYGSHCKYSSRRSREFAAINAMIGLIGITRFDQS
jgi:hypothetical protein